MKHLFIFLVALTLSIPAQAMDSAQTNAYTRLAQNWLTNLQTAQARFQQVDYQGRALSGTFYINKPGRLRFEYDPPVKDYIVADGYQIHFYDGTSGQASSAPIGSTMADFILRSNSNFNDEVNVKSVRERDETIQITLEQKDQPGTGELIMLFAKQPFTLKGWQIIDAQGLTTDIILSNLQNVDRIDPNLFRMRNMKLNE